MTCTNGCNKVLKERLIIRPVNYVKIIQYRSHIFIHQVALFDATNTTRARRSLLLSRAKEEKNIILLFIESICNDPAILQRNYLMKLQNNDYKDMDENKALVVRAN